jgi:hypothetical protein
MRTRSGVVLVILLVAGLAPLVPFATADTVIGAEGAELLEAGDFSDSEEWEISSTAGFSSDAADYSLGMVADGELSFTHGRPDNFQYSTSWASNSITNSNATLGEPDSYYTWSKGPNITMAGYDFSGLHGMLVANVSLVLHFSIPDTLNQDSVRVILQNHGSDKLAVTYARTFGPIYRMTNPVILSLDGLVLADWSSLEDTQFTIDYVSTGTSDDSEVRVDAVGLRVKYHQPWYSFETVKAINTINDVNSPVIDISPYDGTISGLSQESCGLAPEGPVTGEWSFDVEVPPLQQLGRIHVFGTGNHTIWALPDDVEGDYIEMQSGELLDISDSLQHIRIEIEDGCISGARIDVNDPHLVIQGYVSGALSGLADTSYIRFAIDNSLVDSIPLQYGAFSVDVPVGHALPVQGNDMSVGVASRFQWSSNGTAETTVVHIQSMTITGGYSVHWDYDPECLELEDMSFNEDDAGVHLPMDVRCSDDLTAPENLALSVVSSDSGIIEASVVGQYIRIQPARDAWGEASIEVVVSDTLGNFWSDSMLVTVTPVEDPPVLDGLPLTVYIELGQTMVVDLEITDPDTESLALEASRSWATFDAAGDLVLTPVDSGSHSVAISISDGTNEISQNIEVIVTAKPDLLVEMVDVRRDGVSVTNLVDGDIIEIHAYIRNEGRGGADAVDVKCRVDGILVGAIMIDHIESGGLGAAVCDAQVVRDGETLTIEVSADGTGSIAETSESNNDRTVILDVSEGEDGGGSIIDSLDRGPALVFISVGVVLISFTALYFSPNRVRKPFNHKK